MKVRIYKPARSVMQSRYDKDGVWVIEPVLPSRRQPDHLMGWSSSDDPMTALIGRLQFQTSGEALTFVRCRGWAYELIQPNERKTDPKSYLDKFKADRS